MYILLFKFKYLKKKLFVISCTVNVQFVIIDDIFTTIYLEKDKNQISKYSDV